MRVFVTFRALALRLIVALLVGNAAVIVLAQQTPPPPALLDFSSGCTPAVDPCWRGIVVGETTLDSARAQLLQMGYEAGIINDTLHFQYYYSDSLAPGCVKVGYREDASVVSFLRLYCIDNLRIGDVSASLGAVQEVVYRFSPYGDSEFLSFNADSGLAGTLLVVGTGWDSLYRPVSSIDMYAMDPYSRFDTAGGRWRGMTPLWRYCQFVPDYPRC